MIPILFLSFLWVAEMLYRHYLRLPFTPFSGKTNAFVSEFGDPKDGVGFLWFFFTANANKWVCLGLPDTHQ